MANFVEELWNSIFTPGPTPTLLIATNATFATLQLLFFVLLLFTYSIHFLILSVLCGGLWFSINWFATELIKEQQAAQKRQDETIAQSSVSALQEASDGVETDAFSSMISEKKERDASSSSPQQTSAPVPAPVYSDQSSSQPIPFVQMPAQSSTMASVTSRAPDLTTNQSNAPTRLTPAMAGSNTDLRRRRQSLGDSSDYVSTDSEWEKVSDAGDT